MDHLLPATSESFAVGAQRPTGHVLTSAQLILVQRLSARRR